MFINLPTCIKNIIFQNFDLLDVSNAILVCKDWLNNDHIKEIIEEQKQLYAFNKKYGIKFVMTFICEYTNFPSNLKEIKISKFSKCAKFEKCAIFEKSIKISCIKSDIDYLRRVKILRNNGIKIFNSKLQMFNFTLQVGDLKRRLRKKLLDEKFEVSTRCGIEGVIFEKINLIPNKFLTFHDNIPILKKLPKIKVIIFNCGKVIFNEKTRNTYEDICKFITHYDKDWIENIADIFC